MKIIKGKLLGSSTGYNSFAVELLFDHKEPLPAPAGATVVVPFSVRGVANDTGDFSLTLPDGVEPTGPINATVFDPSGAPVLKRSFDSLPPADQLLQLNVQPAEPFELDEHPDPFSNSPAIFAGHVIDRQGRLTVVGRQVVLFGERRLDNGAADPVETVLGVTQSAVNGYFSMPYPRLFLATARLEVSGNIDRTAGEVTLVEDRMPAEVRILVDIPPDSPDTPKPNGVPRAPEPEDLTNASEVFTADPTVGKCVRLNTPNRTLEEYQYFTVVRTTDPFILGQRPRRPIFPPRSVLDLAGKLAFGTKTIDSNLQPNISRERRKERPTSAEFDLSDAAVAASWRNYLDPESVTTTLEKEPPQISSDVLASVLNDPDGFTPIQLMTAERLSAFNYLRDVVSLSQRPPRGRQEMSVSNPADWDGLPRAAQATTIAHGHMLQFRQIWKADGYSLGDLVYSLPLAPCQKKEIVIVDWDRRESAIRSESRVFQERLDARLEHDRGVSEIVKSVLTENVRGGSSSNVWAAGGGFGLGIPIGSGFLGIGGGGGAGGASSEAWQDSSRSLTASTLQQLRERITQSASALRSQRISVVQSVRQGETHQVQSEVVANHNHSHAITVEYFEVLQHFQIHHRLTSVRECLFIPLLMTEFTDNKVLRWRDAIEPFLLDPSLAEGFDAIERIQSGYAGSNFPVATYAEELMRTVSGELNVRLSIARPRDPGEDEALEDYFEDVWSFFGPSLAKTLYNMHINGQQEKDRRFQSELAPRIARQFVDSIGAQFKLLNDTFVPANLDVSMVGSYREGGSHLIRINPSAGTPQHQRNQVKGILLATFFNLPAGSRVIVERASIQYSADTHSETLHSSPRLFSDLTVTDPLFLSSTRFSEFERSNPRLDDLGRRRRLLRHLNENLEHYHRIIWWRMDASRRFMLLDGFEAPFTNGRSVASVVENRIVGIVGNCLVMPVASGYQLDPRYRQRIENPEEGEVRPPTLLDLYTPLTPPRPLRLSLPTKGVFAESVMGDCNSSEVIDDTRFWRWEEEPCPDDPTPINAVSTASLRTAPPVLTPKELPAPIVNIQNAPAAPAPTGLGAALEVLGNAAAFRDITGLTQNQMNALAALQSSLKTAESFGKQAAGFVKAQASQRRLPRVLEAIKKAKDEGIIDDADTKELTAKAYEAAFGLPAGSTDKPVDKPGVKEMISSAAKSPKMKTSVTEQVGDRKQTVTVEKDDTAKAGVDVQVVGKLRPLKQPTNNTCWATVATILFSWKNNSSPSIEEVVTAAGQEFLDLFNADQGLQNVDKPRFLEALGLIAEPPKSLNVEGFAQLLDAHGPLWITTDEDLGENFSVHARVLIGLRGDGTPENTQAIFLDTDPNTPSPDSESVAELQDKLAQLAIGDSAGGGSFRAQIVHF
jgi:Papain-like cysteine protease AvrRpt2